MDAQVLQRIADGGADFAVALLAHVQGSAPQKAGARLLVHPDGVLEGTIGGGCLEMETRRRALLCLRERRAELFDLRLDDDFGWDDGLICGGRTTVLVCPDGSGMAEACREALERRGRGERCVLETVLEGPSAGETRCVDPDPALATPEIVARDAVRVLREPVHPEPTLIVCGCGHIGTALVGFAAQLGFRVVAVDDRADFADAARLPGAAEVRCDDLQKAARTVASGPDTYWVIVTRGHRNDGRVLAEAIRRESAYVGMIGSRRKVRLIRDGLRTEGVPEERIASVHAPVGLAIGAQTPQEIALSIAAQLVAVRRLGRTL